MHKGIDPLSSLLLKDKKAKLGMLQMSSGTGPCSLLPWWYKPWTFPVPTIIVGIGLSTHYLRHWRGKPLKLPTSLGMPPMSLEFPMESHSRLLERFPIDEGRKASSLFSCRLILLKHLQLPKAVIMLNLSLEGSLVKLFPARLNHWMYFNLPSEERIEPENESWGRSSEFSWEQLERELGNGPGNSFLQRKSCVRFGIEKPMLDGKVPMRRSKVIVLTWIIDMLKTASRMGPDKLFFVWPRTCEFCRFPISSSISLKV